MEVKKFNEYTTTNESNGSENSYLQIRDTLLVSLNNRINALKDICDNRFELAEKICEYQSKNANRVELKYDTIKKEFYYLYNTPITEADVNEIKEIADSIGRSVRMSLKLKNYLSTSPSSYTIDSLLSFFDTSRIDELNLNTLYFCETSF